MAFATFNRARRFGLATSALALSCAALSPAHAETGLAETGLAEAGSLLDAETFALAASSTATPLPAGEGPAPMPAQDGAEAAPQAAPQAPPPPPPPEKVRLRVVASQFLETPVAGDAPSDLNYSGRIDGYLEVGGHFYGGSDNITIRIRPELSWGDSMNGQIGLIPANTALYRPEGKGDFDLSASVEYKWDSGATLEVGKMNVLDTSGQLPIVASDGHYGFMNLGLALPPTAVVPNTLTGAMLTVPSGKWIYRAWVFDPDSQYQRTGFETAFESGVGFMAAAARRTSVNRMPGVLNVALVGSTRERFAADILPRALTPPPGGSFGDESGELALQLSYYQYIKLYPEARGKGWGVLARFQASMGDPTFLDYSGYFGVSGNPRFRPNDRFGLAYFQYSLTDELADDIAFRLGIEDESGVEAFYTYQFAEGFGLTANVQVVDSAIAFRDTGVTLGARLTTSF
ncbi:carbohydrate porin [Qipengyuania nanhaisediminis]|uniref:carbohydrate porin n=1 Tax=Qipengyuania nanhaisediminis TaxID=604088 RepID=UPI0038B3B813